MQNGWGKLPKNGDNSPLVKMDSHFPTLLDIPEGNIRAIWMKVTFDLSVVNFVCNGVWRNIICNEVWWNIIAMGSAGIWNKTNSQRPQLPPTSFHCRYQEIIMSGASTVCVASFKSNISLKYIATSFKSNILLLFFHKQFVSIALLWGSIHALLVIYVICTILDLREALLRKKRQKMWCSLMLIDSDWFRLVPIDSGWFRLVLIDADCCWLILI